MILSTNFVFHNTKISDIKPQIIDFKNLDDSLGLTNLCSPIDLSGLCSLQPYFLKKHPGKDDMIITGTKMTNTSHLLQNESSRIQFFTDIWYLFLSEAVEASLCYFLENLLMKLKCPNLRNIQIPSL